MAATAMLLPAAKRQLLDELIEGLDAQALVWVSGYAAGLAAKGDATLPDEFVEPVAAVEKAPTLTVLYGSQTGNARRWAEQIAEEARAAGLGINLVSTGQYKPRDLKSETHLVVVISTQGDGEPPDDALDFMEFVLGKRAPLLDNLNYAVLALGDSSYPEFCVTGRRLDERLSELGAHRVCDRADCDLDIEAIAAPWWEGTLGRLREIIPEAAPAQHVATVTPLHPETRYGRANPFPAQVLENQRITGRDADKDVRHLELTLEGSALHYRPGDSLGVWPRNPEVCVNAMLTALDADGDMTVSRKGEERPLREWLTDQCEITQLAKPLLAAHAERSRDAEFQSLLEPDRREELGKFLDTHQPIDLLHQWPVHWGAEEWVNTLRPLTPRLYSIASSPTVADEEAHLTVARVAYDRFGQPHVGAASEYLCASDDEGRIPIYVEENPRFRLPDDGATDVIMVGAGTGVAPFRAFMQEREEAGASGRNWLFFGARHFHSQFLYQLEWQAWLKGGVLNCLDLAFSRDQAERIHVQRRVAERGRELYGWLEEGAQMYVCGAIAMEKAVRDALREVAAAQLGDPDRAADWLSELQRSGRYSRDVY